MFFKKEKKILIFILFSVLLIFFVLYFSFGLIIEKHLTENDLERILFEKSGLSYKIEGFKLKTTYNLNVVTEFNNLSVLTPDENKTIAELNQPRIRIEILPLIFKNVVLRDFSAQSANADLKLEENGELEILKYLKQDEKFKLKFKKTDINLGNYSFNLDDLYNKSKLSVNGDFLNLSKFNPEKYIGIKTKGIITLNNKKSYYDMDISSKLPINKHLKSSDIDFNLMIKDFDLSPLGLYFKNNGIDKAEGIVNADIKTKDEKTHEGSNFKISADNLFIKGNDFSIKNKEHIDFSSVLYLNGNNLNLENMSFVTKDVNIKGGGVIKKINSKKPHLDFDLKINDTEMGRLLSLAPENLDLTPEKYLVKSKKYNLYALLNGEMNLKGSIFEPDILGKLDVKNVYVEEKGPNAPLGLGTVDFKGKKFGVDIIAKTPEGEEVYIKGISDLYGNKYGEYKVTSTNNVDLSQVHVVLCPIRDIVGFKLGPVPIMKIGGKGSIDIDIQGTIDNAKIDGWFKFHNTKATIEGFSDWLTDANGEILFLGEDMNFKNWKAKLHKSEVTANGYANVKGKFSMDFDVKKLSLKESLVLLKTSDIMKDYSEIAQYIKDPEGNIDFLVNVSGEFLDFTKEALENDTKISGNIKLYNNSVSLIPSKLRVNSLNGKIGFGEKIQPEIKGKIYNSPFSVVGSIKEEKTLKKIDLNLKSDKISSLDIYKILNIQNNFLEKNPFYLASDINVKGDIQPLDDPDISKLIFNGWIKGINNENSPLKFESGIIKLSGKDSYIDNLNIKYYDSKLNLKGNIKNILSKKPKPILDVSLENFSLETLINSLMISRNIKVTSDISEFKGVLSGEFSVRGEDFKGSIKPKDIGFYLKPKKCHVALKSGDIFLDNKSLKLKAFNMLLDNTPLYLNAAISNFLSKRPLIDAKFSSNIDSTTLNKFVNTNLTYPVKLSGEALFSGRLWGYSDDYTIDSNLVLEEGNDLEYMGANFGDTDTKRQISANINFIKNTAKINRAKYEKFVVSQNNKSNPLPMLQANGSVVIGEDDIYFKNIKIKTLNSVTAKIFNLAFKKSILKRGLFDCDLSINGGSKNPKLLGNANFKDLNIPLYDLEVQGADLDFNKDIISADFKLKSYNSDVFVKTRAVNDFKTPVVIKDLNIQSDIIDISKILSEFSQTSKIQQSSANSGNSQSIVLNPKDIVIENGSVDAKKVLFNNIEAKNLKGVFSQDDKGIFKADNVAFDIAGGKIKTSGMFDFSHISLDFNSKIDNCDADALVSSLFNTPGQLYGTMNGEIIFSGKNLNTKEGINTIRSKADFEILNGKMPKLGSLEYLLRAGNFYKSGILGFSLNNLIDVLNPYKTGEFKSIKGRISMREGIMDNIEIYSKGENLSIFLNGRYDIPQKNADIFVFGRLSKKVSSALGAMGNASLNSIVNIFSSKDTKVTDSEIIQNINKIPLIEISNDDFRLFSARIKGDLNKDNYVKTFNWLN